MQNITWLNVISAVSILYLLYRVVRWVLIKTVGIYQETKGINDRLTKLENMIQSEDGMYYVGNEWFGYKKKTIDKRVELLENELNKLKESNLIKVRNSKKGND